MSTSHFIHNAKNEFRILTLIAFLFICNSAHAFAKNDDTRNITTILKEDSHPKNKNKQAKGKKKVDDSQKKQKEDILIVEIEPTFPGGEKARIKFLQKNLIYPEEAAEQRLSGVVYVSFVVERDGSISNVSVYKGIAKCLDEEAMRITKMMPKWNPGMHKGQHVRVALHMPIRFTFAD